MNFIFFYMIHSGASSPVVVRRPDEIRIGLGAGLFHLPERHTHS